MRYYLGIAIIVVSLLITTVVPYFFIVVVIIAFMWKWSNIRVIINSALFSSDIDTDLAHFKYVKAQYLKSDLWEQKRQAVLRRASYVCECCGADAPLDVHHTAGYNRIPNESLTCLVALCRSCHDFQHIKYGFPQTYTEYMYWYAPISRTLD